MSGSTKNIQRSEKLNMLNFLNKFTTFKKKTVEIPIQPVNITFNSDIIIENKKYILSETREHIHIKKVIPNFTDYVIINEDKKLIIRLLKNKTILLNLENEFSFDMNFLKNLDADVIDINSTTFKRYDTVDEKQPYIATIYIYDNEIYSKETIKYWKFSNENIEHLFVNLNVKTGKFNLWRGKEILRISDQ